MAGDGMARQNKASREAVSRLPKLDIREVREGWRFLYKTDASLHLSRELLIRAVAYRMQEVALHRTVAHPWLFVIARNSSFTYEGQAVDVKEIGRELR
jgi:hypothetical protein